MIVERVLSGQRATAEGIVVMGNDRREVEARRRIGECLTPIGGGRRRRLPAGAFHDR